jgi:hypothetical protein
MKTLIIAFGLLFATAAFGQTASVLSNNPQPAVVPDHPQHAAAHAMGEEVSLFGPISAYTYAQGERPLWEFGSSDKREIPLGDVARAYRKGHVIDRKAVKTLDSE